MDTRIVIRHPRKREFFSKLALRGQTAQSVLSETINQYLNQEDIMTYTAINTFHGTEAPVTVIETYENDYGRVAIIEDAELDRVAQKLCGIADCQCNSIGKIQDESGQNYAYAIP